MKIKYLGHSSFLITSQDGKKIVTDPYNVGHGLNYGPIHESADIVTVSHGHGDHNNVSAIQGNPVILKEAGAQTVKGIEIFSTLVYHDEARGSKRGTNVIFCLKVDGVNVCHLGDLGHSLSLQQLSGLGPVDVLLTPVGGFFTIDAQEAAAVARSIGAKVIIPMHFKTPKADYDIQSVEEFLKNQKNVRRLETSEVEFQKTTLPPTAEVVVLQPAL